VFFFFREMDCSFNLQKFIFGRLVYPFYFCHSGKDKLKKKGQSSLQSNYLFKREKNPFWLFLCECKGVFFLVKKIVNHISMWRL